MTRIILSILLFYNSITDIKHKTIYVWPNVIAGLAGICWRGCERPDNWFVLISGIIPGVMLWMLAHVFSGAVGKGDGLIFMSTGSWLDMKCNLELMAWTCFLAGIIAGVLLFLKKANRKTEMPLAPVVLITYVGRSLI